MISTENIRCLFHDLDRITRPLGIQTNGYILIFKSYTRMVEKFLRNIKLEMMLKYSWAQVFNIRMASTKKIITKERYHQYVEAVKFYIELVNNVGAAKKKHNSKHEKFVGIATDFLNFLRTHEVDIDSSLVGLYPSEYALEECVKQEKQLPLKIMNMKHCVDDAHTLKAEMKTILSEVSIIEKIAKGDLVIKRKPHFCFARYNGEHAPDYSTLTVWSDISETTTEKVAWSNIIILTPALRQTILSCNEESLGVLVCTPVQLYYHALTKITQLAIHKYLSSQQVDSSLLTTMSDEKVCHVEIEQLATMRDQLKILCEDQSHEFYTTLEHDISQKIEKIQRKFSNKIYIPRKEQVEENHLEFLQSIRLIAAPHISSYYKSASIAFENSYKQYLDGKKKEEFNDWVLMHIEHKATQYLEHLGFDFAAVPDNYIEEPPKSEHSLIGNIAMLKILMDKRSTLPMYVSDICNEIQSKVDMFIARCYVALSAELSYDIKTQFSTLNCGLDSERLMSSMRSMLSEPHAGSLPSERVRYLLDYVEQLGELLKMTNERKGAPTHSVNEVTYGGLVVSPFVRLFSECNTAYEVWHQKESGKEDNNTHRKEDIDEYTSEKIISQLNEYRANNSSSNNIPHHNTTISVLKKLPSFFKSNDNLKHYLPESPKKNTNTNTNTITPPSTPRFHEAVACADLSSIFEIVGIGKSVDLNALDENGWSALHCAAYNVAHQVGDVSHSMEVLKLLVSCSGIDVNIASNRQITALHILAKTPLSFPDREGLLGALDLMTVKGARVFQPNFQEEIPLHLACLGGNPDIVEFLLSVGSDPNAITRTHQSCLHYAIHGGHAAIVKKLLAYGANPNALSPDGTPMDVAKAKNLHEILHVLETSAAQQAISAASHAEKQE